MSYNLKKFFAVLIIIIIAAGWYVTIWGIPGVMSPVKDKIQLGLDIKGGVYAVLEADTGKLSGDKLNETMDQIQAVINERVNQMGLKEPTVTTEGKNKLRVELPGAEDSKEAIDAIGQTAQLEFRLANKALVMDGNNVKDAAIDKDSENGGYKVVLEFDKEGGKKFEQGTKDALSGMVKSQYPEKDNVADSAMVIILDNKIISAPTVNQVISGTSCEITGGSGGFSQEEASKLSALIRGGALPVPLKVVSSSEQSATIGMNALTMSVLAGLIGIALILLIMAFGYRIMGLAANIALLFYVVIIVAVMAIMGSVLTLPGIAGIILSVGMAVDANVVIFSRIKEEICEGKSVRIATQVGFKRALGTVIDSQVTTLIAALVLYQVGTSSVKGFAWTLMIGILASIFTAVVVTHLYLSLFAEGKRFSKKSFFGIKETPEGDVQTFEIKKKLTIIKHRKKFYCITLAILLVGIGFFAFKGFNYGIDFTGGTMLQLDMGKKVQIDDVEKVLAKEGLDMDKTTVIYSGKGNKQVIIKTTDALDNDQRADLVDKTESELGIKNINVLASELFGPSVGKELRNNAFKALIIAAFCMLIYIRIRFSEWKFGGAALLAVLHDVLLMLAFYAIFRVTVNNPFIAGILTVVGYSINDTIVIFDRIRENIKRMRRVPREEMIDKSINQTLTRSVMTSVTTLVVMIPLYFMTGTAIREFTLPLMVGIIVGCLSSIFIASPLYYEFAEYLDRRKYGRRRGGNKNNSKKKKDK